MKNANTWMAAVWLLAGLIGGPGLRAQDKDASAPAATKQTSADGDSKAAKTETAEKPGATAKDAPADADAAKSDATERPAARPASSRAANRANQPGSDRMLRLNFRGAPLETVLNYLSEAAGFIIVLETDVRGKVDAWSNQPVTQEEALSILDAALSKNGYAALRNGRTLTVINKDNAKRRDIPVKTGSNPAGIPKNEEIVTQIIPLRYISASQLTQNLQSLLPSSAELTANEGGNALIMTDTQINIRRITEIIRALDTSMASATTIRVFPLQFADAKDLANVIKELFPAQSTGGTGGFGGFGGGNNNRGGFGQGGGFPGGFGQGGFGQGGAGAAAGGFGGARTGSGGGGVNRAAASRVVAVADEHSNSLVVNAPDDVMPEIEELITKVDTSVEDVTELRVFRLKHADPMEMADVLSNLFPDDTKSNDNSRSQVRFGGGPFGFGGGGNNRNAAAAGSERAKKKGRVLAVPDQRTSSVIVSAAHDLMGQIGEMVAQLDSNPARKQKVFVYDLQNADPQQVQDVLRNLFENQNTMNRNTRSGSQNQSSALTTRANQSQNNRNTSGSFGTGGGGGGTGFGGGRAGGN